MRFRKNFEKRLLAVCPAAWNNSAPSGLFHISALLENLSRQAKIYQNPTLTTGTLHKDIRTFMTTR